MGYFFYHMKTLKNKICYTDENGQSLWITGVWEYSHVRTLYMIRKIAHYVF